ncbi:MAG: 1-(5-phosphoribosyl)-5-[(5-phosphoribosylamino)methylideneamino]imidazole-4-carboxamide isomerase [Acidimicrobiales bacterium]
MSLDHTHKFDLYPAIDLLAGRCVRLHQGDFDLETVYGDDPVAQALAFASEGASWIHVVDLDAARSGEPLNRPAIEAIASALDIPVQTGGGVRTAADAEALLDHGVRRVVLGTAALEDAELIRRLAAAHPGSVSVGLDAYDGDVAVRGWTQVSGRSVLDVARSFTGFGLASLIVTEIGRDGTLAGPDIAGLRALLRETDIEVIASGGVGDVDDLVALRDVEVEGRRLGGAIIGRALYEGRFRLAEAIEALMIGEVA